MFEISSIFNSDLEDKLHVMKISFEVRKIADYTSISIL